MGYMEIEVTISLDLKGVLITVDRGRLFERVAQNKFCSKGGS